MEKQEKRISRVERNSRKYKKYKKLKSSNEKFNDTSIDNSNVNYVSKDDDIINTSKIRIRRSERNKRKNRTGIFGNVIKNKEAELNKRDKNMKIAAILLIIKGIVIIGASLTFYFKSHFYWGTSINCLNVSGKSVDDVENEFKSNIVDYNLKLTGRNNSQDEIRGKDIELNYDDSKKSEIEQIKNEQNKSSWIKSLFTEKENGISISSEYTSSIVTYDKEKLQKVVDNLNLIKNENISEPKNASLKYEGKSFVIEKEVQGNKLDKEKLYDEISKAITSGQTELDLDKEGCYENPKYTSSSKEVVQALNKMNEYKDFKLTYDLGSDTQEIYGDKLFDFFEFDDNYECNINEDKISDYVDELCKKYNTYGTSRNFMTADGRNIVINGGDYGYQINKNEEINQIKQDIEGKKSVSRKPVYSKTALGDVTNDIGSTYVEINMSKQHLWFYKDGALVTEGDVVTGNVGNGTATPEGTYSLKYKAKDSVLVGEGYRSLVSFWMPFNNNIGIHDASWRSTFGGKIYLSNGSHGCVNAPYKLAQSIYSNIEAGTPVICYN